MDIAGRSRSAAALVLVVEAAYVTVGIVALLTAPWTAFGGVPTVIGLALGLVGLSYLVVTMRSTLGRPPAQQPPRVERPWSVLRAAALLGFYEAVYLAVGMYALLHQEWEDLGAVLTFLGLVIGVIGIAYLVATVPALLGRRWARVALVVLTASQIAFLINLAVEHASDGLSFNMMSPLLTTLPPLIGVVLLFLAPSRPFFAGRPTTPAPSTDR